MFHPDTSSSALRVLNGDFPEECVKNMSRKKLENLVLKLVQCSSKMETRSSKDFRGLYKSLCLKQFNKPDWWPSEKIIEQSLTSDGEHLMQVLRFLVYKCCEFFKKPNETFNLNDSAFVNDENCLGLKRPKSHCLRQTRRPTLKPKNIKTGGIFPLNGDNKLNKYPIIPLRDIFYCPKANPPRQETFLTHFGLQNVSLNFTEEKIHCLTSTSIKFVNCPVIPISSDLGRQLMKRDNHYFPDNLKERKLERTEWYLNKVGVHNIEIKYENTYQERKETTLHMFKFPRRQMWQYPGDSEYYKRKLLSKNLKVKVARENLELLKIKIQNKKLFRELKIVIPKVCITNPISKQTAMDNKSRFTSSISKSRNRLKL